MNTSVVGLIAAVAVRLVPVAPGPTFAPAQLSVVEREKASDTVSCNAALRVGLHTPLEQPLAIDHDTAAAGPDHGGTALAVPRRAAANLRAARDDGHGPPPGRARASRPLPGGDRRHHRRRWPAALHRARVP